MKKSKFKRVYFVRHGESMGNAGPIRQHKGSPLTEKGRAQSAVVAERCLKLPFDAIICSTMSRAKETADFILKKVSKPIEYSDLFVERRRPSEQYGAPKGGPIDLKIEREVDAHFHVPGYRYSNEENFDDLKERARAALEYLARRPEEDILVVTHGLFMRIVLAYVVFGDKLSGKEGSQFLRAFHTMNTGITVLMYDENEKESPWWVWIWNDHAHLG